MLAISRELQTWILAAMVAVAAWFAGKWLLRALAREMIKNVMANRPRAQPVAYVLRLRDLLFANPYAIMNRLWADDRDAFVKQLWREVGTMAARGRAEGNLSSDSMAVHRLHLDDGRAIAVIEMPPPEKNHEPYLLGVVLPGDALFKDDLNRTRSAVEMFVLWRGGGGDNGRTTDLCSWRADGRELTYNVGAPRDVAGFAKAVGAKLRELGR